MADRTLRIKLTANTDSYRAEMDRASRLGTNYYRTMSSSSRRLEAQLASNNRAFERINGQMVSATNLAKGFLAVFAGGFAVGNLVNIADSWGQMAARIRLALSSVEGSADSYASVQDRLLEISNRNARAIEQSQEIYIQSADSMKGLGYSTSQTLDFIETLSNEFTINATSADKTQSSINALSKAMATGKLDSNAFTTILSAMPTVANELAIYLKKDINEVKALGLAGKISMRDFANAMIEAKGKTTDLANSMENSIADGITKVSNSFKSLLGEANQTYGVTYKVSEGLDLLAKNMDVVVKAGTVIVGLGVARYFGQFSNAIYGSTARLIDNNRQLYNHASAQVAATKALRDKAVMEGNAARYDAQRAIGLKANLIAQNNLTAAIKRQVIAEKELALARGNLNKVTSGMTLLSRAGSGLLGIMGGPVGLIATVGILAASFWDFGDSADKTKESLVNLQTPVEELIQKYTELNRLQKETFKTDLANNIDDEKLKINELTNNMKQYAKSLLETQISMGDGVYASGIFNDEDQTKYDAFITAIESANEAADKGKINNHEYAQTVYDIYQSFIKSAGVSDKTGKQFNNLSTQIAGALDNLLKYRKVKENVNDIDSFVGPQLPNSPNSSTNSLPPDTSLYDNALKRINDQINATKLLTEAAKMRYETEHGGLQDLDELQKKQLINAASQLDLAKERTKQLENYKKLEESLRSEEQVQLDDYKQKYDLIQKMAKSEAERLENMKKLAEQTVSKAPGSAMSSYTGIGSDMINVAEQDKKLDEWRASELKKQDEFHKKGVILKKEYEENKLKIEEEYNRINAQNQSAMELATLSTFSSMTGSIADMFKETAGESSAAYKIMFLASKASALAQSAIATEVAATEALKFGGGGLAGITMSNIVRGLGYASIGMIASQSIAGMAHDGIDNIPKEGTWLLDKGERVVDARTNADLKGFIKSNKSAGNLTVTVPVNINDGSVSEQDGKQLGQMIKQSVIAVIEEQQRPGGILNKR